MLKTLKANPKFVLLDLALLGTAILLTVTPEKIFFFHVIFVLLTIGAFYWRLRAFIIRSGLWVTTTVVVLIIAIFTSGLPPTELVEIPMLVLILLLVFFIARYRARAEETLVAALESLHNSEERFRSVAQTASAGIITATSQGEIIFCNEAATKMFGYERMEVIGQPVTLLIPERLHPVYQNGLTRFNATGKSTRFGTIFESVACRKDNQEFPVELSLSSWETGEGHFLTGIFNDITARKQTEAALRAAHDDLELRVKERTAALAETNEALQAEIIERQQTEERLRASEERYRRLVELSFEAIIIHSEERLVYLNPPAIELLGATNPGELIGQSIRDFVHPDCWDMVYGRVQQVGRGRNGVPLAEEKFVRLDGSVVDVEAVSVPVTYQGRPAVQTVVHDISVRKQAELERERERNKIARNLHDSLGHSLGYLHLKLDELVDNDISPTQSGEREALRRMRDVANDAYELVRGMLASLRPANANDLTTALLMQARKIGQRGGFKVQLTSEGQLRPLPPIIQQQLLYLCQESLINVERHAAAQQVTIELEWQATALVVRLADDGRGFDLHSIPPAGRFGLTIMHERARDLAGKLTIDTAPASGTVITLYLPLEPVSQAALTPNTPEKVLIHENLNR